jgi:hypothetical protein
MKLLSFLLPALLLPGCTTVELAGVDRTDYSLYEFGQPRVFHVASVFSHASGLPAGGRYDTILVEQIPAADNHALLERMRNDAPAWLRLERLAQAIDELGKSVPTEGPRWVLSNNPLVIAIGPRPTTAPTSPDAGPPLRGDGPVRPPGGLRLVTAADLDQPATRLFVIAKWQSRAGMMTSSRYTILPGEPIDALPAELPLQSPTTLKALLASHPWIRISTTNPAHAPKPAL